MEGLSPMRMPPPSHFRRQSQVVGSQCTHNFCLTRLHIGGFHYFLSLWIRLICYSGSQNLGKQLYLPDYERIWWRIWVSNQMKRCIVKGWEGSQMQEFLLPWSWNVLPSQYMDVLTNLEAFWTHTTGIFMEASSHRHDWSLTHFQPFYFLKK